MKSSKILALLTAGFFAFTGTVTAQNQGKEIFQKTCGACHSVGKGKIVGPDLSGVKSRRSEDWILKFVKNSQDLVNAGDKDAVAVFNDNNKIVMPPQPLNDDEIRQVLAYIDTEGGASASASAAPADTTPGDAVIGEHLFLGMQRLENGGPSCNSCHNIDYKNLLTGGSLAKDLTDASGRLGEAGVIGIVGAPPFPAMKQAYASHPISPKEVKHIAAFLGEVDKAKGTDPPQRPAMMLLIGGIGAATLLLGMFAILWSGRRRGSVNQKIYDRQVKAQF